MSRFDFLGFDNKALMYQNEFKQAFEHLERLLQELGASRSQALAVTKLEEAYMWVGKAIRDEQIARQSAETKSVP